MAPFSGSLVGNRVIRNRRFASMASSTGGGLSEVQQEGQKRSTTWCDQNAGLCLSELDQFHRLVLGGENENENSTEEASTTYPLVRPSTISNRSALIFVGGGVALIAVIIIMVLFLLCGCGPGGDASKSQKGAGGGTAAKSAKALKSSKGSKKTEGGGGKSSKFGGKGGKSAKSLKSSAK